MQVQTHYKNLKKTKDLEGYIEKKVGAIGQKFRLEPLTAEVGLSKVGSEYISRCRLSGCRARLVSASDFDVFASVDSVVEKIAAVLRREKERRIRQKKRADGRCDRPDILDDYEYEVPGGPLINGGAHIAADASDDGKDLESEEVIDFCEGSHVAQRAADLNDDAYLLGGASDLNHDAHVSRGAADFYEDINVALGAADFTDDFADNVHTPLDVADGYDEVDETSGINDDPHSLDAADTCVTAPFVPEAALFKDHPSDFERRRDIRDPINMSRIRGG